jgi:predicted DsbA family dithiol-disulfide isomerase
VTVEWSVASGTVQVWSDLLDPFAHLALHRFRQARERAALPVAVEHRTFALELFNGPHPRRGTDTEAVGVGQAAPELDWRVWTAAEDTYPHTVLLAAEAVHAAQAQSLAVGEALDLALRRAFWTQSRSIAHRAVILDVAAEVPDLDVAALAEALDDGRYRREVTADHVVAQTDAIQGSPTFRLPGGEAVHNPGTQVTWEGPWAAGFPVITAHDATVFDDIVRQAAAR